MKSRFLLQITFTIFVVGCNNAPRYGLPVALGLSSVEVRSILGPPNETVKPPKILGDAIGQGVEDLTLEYF